MNGDLRGRLVDELVKEYTRDQLDSLVRQTLRNPLTHYVSAVSNHPTQVDHFIGELELQPEVANAFLLWILGLPPRRPQLRSAIRAYLGLPAAPDAYAALLVFDEVFVDRHLFRAKLRDLFKSEVNRVLVARGPRFCGRTHSKWLIQHVADSEGIKVVVVDLLEVDVSDAIADLINEMSLDPKEFADRMAQASTKTKGFASALRGYSKADKSGDRWCLVFDHFDREQVPKASRELVELLVRDAALQSLPNISVIVLGHSGSFDAQFAHRILDEDILPLQPTDVERYLSDVAADRGRVIAPADLAKCREKVFANLNLPLDFAGMQEMSKRLRSEVAAL
jgi:hypothetical protein